MEHAYLVLRLDHYDTESASRGQFYPVQNPNPDGDAPEYKAMWPTLELAVGAAKWATEKFGHQYGVFGLVAFVEHANVPVKVITIK